MSLVWTFQCYVGQLIPCLALLLIRNDVRSAPLFDGLVWLCEVGSSSVSIDFWMVSSASGCLGPVPRL